MDQKEDKGFIAACLKLSRQELREKTGVRKKSPVQWDMDEENPDDRIVP
jgi:hypothetical protein